MYTNRVFYFLILTPCSGLIRTLCNTPWVREILICLRRNKAEMFARRLNNPRGWVTNGSFHSRWVFPAGNRTKINEPGDLPKLFGRPEVGIIHPHGNIYSFDYFFFKIVCLFFSSLARRTFQILKYLFISPLLSDRHYKSAMWKNYSSAAA